MIVELYKNKTDKEPYKVYGGGNIQFKIDTTEGRCGISSECTTSVNGSYYEYDCVHYIISSGQRVKIYSHWD